MSEAQIELEIERRLQERRKQTEEYLSATLSPDDVRELKKIATYSRVGKIITAGFVALGGVAYALAELYIQFKQH